MTERDSFLQAIREAPDDWALRLVFADWLDEHDDPLGPFIRVQVVRVVDAPDRRPAGFSAKDWRQAIRSLHGWMDDGDFIIDCWNDYWAGAGGVITAS